MPAATSDPTLGLGSVIVQMTLGLGLLVTSRRGGSTLILEVLVTALCVNTWRFVRLVQRRLVAAQEPPAERYAAARLGRGGADGRGDHCW